MGQMGQMARVGRMGQVKRVIRGKRLGQRWCSLCRHSWDIDSTVSRCDERCKMQIPRGYLQLRKNRNKLITLGKEREPAALSGRLQDHCKAGSGPTARTSRQRARYDVGLLTCNPAFGEDATNLFNLLTGICRPQETHRLLIAPFGMLHRIIALIDREAENARRGLPARIVAKMNALVEAPIIEALYRASAAGVEIDLIVRGVCCLRPGVPGLSTHIRVRSIVDRFLEHARIWSFDNAHRPEVFVGSADWMPRNLHRRIEVVFPIEDGRLREHITSKILATELADNTKARLLMRDGSYRKSEPTQGAPRHRAQAEFIERALQFKRTIPSGRPSQPEKLRVRRRP